jgi:hypothetical protein
MEPIRHKILLDNKTFDINVLKNKYQATAARSHYQGDNFFDISSVEIQPNALTEKELQSEIGPGSYDSGITHMNKT